MAYEMLMQQAKFKQTEHTENHIEKEKIEKETKNMLLFKPLKILLK